MKKWLIIVAIVLFVLAGGYLTLSFYAVKFLEPWVQKAVGPGSAIAQIKVKTTCLSVNGIQIENPHTKQKFLQIEEMRIYPDLRSFFSKRVQIRELVILRPSFFFYRTQEGDFIGPWVTIKKEEKREAAPDKGEKREREAIPIRIDCIRIEKGSIDFEDMKTDPSGQIRLREVELKIEKIEYPPASSRSHVELKGKMIGKGKTGEVVVRGWIDLKTSDTETSLKIQEADMKVFEPYYRKRVSTEIMSGTMNMDGYIAIKKRALKAGGKLEVVDLQMKEEGTLFYIPAKKFHSQLKHKGNRMEVQFHVKGNLNDPRFKLQEVLLMQIGLGMAKAIGFPIKAVEGVDKDDIY